MHSWIAHTPLFRDIVGIRRPADLYRALTGASLDFEADAFNDRTYGRKDAGEVSDAFLDWQSAHRERPFFAFLNYFDAHVAYRSPPSFAQRFALKNRPNMGRYDGAIAYIDHEIGRMLGELRQRGVLDNTIVIVTSDHGELFGDHGLTLHANSLYLPLLHVPLVIRYPPGVAKGAQVDTPVTLRDLAATVIDLARLSDQIRMPGSSLATLWSGHDSSQRSSPIVSQIERLTRPQSDWPVFFGPMQSVIDRQFHYIRRGDGAEELYDYRADVAEANNLGNTPGGLQEIVRLRALLGALPEQ